MARDRPRVLAAAWKRKEQGAEPGNDDEAERKGGAGVERRGTGSFLAFFCAGRVI